MSGRNLFGFAGVLTLVFLAGSPSSYAGEAPGFRFTGPEVTKVDWGARSLHAADFNGDGRVDVALVNEDRSRVEIHYRLKNGEPLKDARPSRPDRWEPVLEDAPYARENLAVDGEVATLASGDFDGDGHLDLAYGDPEDGLFVRFREKDGSWAEPTEVDARELRSYHGSLAAEDLNGDGAPELLVHVAEGLQVFTFDEERKPSSGENLFRDDSPRTRGLFFADLDGDGRRDWLYLAPGGERSVRCRLRRGDGFGPEISHAFQARSGLNLLPKGLNGKGEPAFVLIEADTEEVALLNLSAKGKPKENGGRWTSLERDVFGEADSATSFSLADFTGDGLPDLAAASSSDPSILLFRGLSDGSFSTPASFPSFSGIESLAGGNLLGQKVGALLVVVSPEEKLVGFTSFENDRRFRFPKAVTAVGEPVRAACADLDGNGWDELLLVTKERYDYVLRRFTFDASGEPTETHELELDGIKRDPSELIAADLDGDGHLDLLVLSSREPALLLRGDGKGVLSPAAEDSSVRKSLLDGLPTIRLGLADLDGDERPEILVAGKGYVRAVALRGDELQVVDQFNSRSAGEQLLAPFVHDISGDGSLELFFYRGSGHFDELARDKDGVYRHSRSREVGPMDLERLLLRPACQDRPAELLAFGKNAFRRIPLGPQVGLPRLATLSKFGTELRGVSHDAVDFGDFDSDGVLDFLCLDASGHLLEFFRRTDDGKEWKSVMHFHVFEENLHYRGRKGSGGEPREGLVADLNGDGKDDFLLLAHDRLLHYYQN